jgi:hypothetical protein
MRKSSDKCENSLFEYQLIVSHLFPFCKPGALTSVTKKYSSIMNTPPPPDPIWVEDPSTSGFFMQTPGSSNLTWIQDLSPSGFSMTPTTSRRAPRLPTLEVVPESAPEVVEEAIEVGVEEAVEEENSHPLLIHTYKSGHKRKIFRDRRGLYIAYKPNPADEEDWLRTRARLHGSLPVGAISTQTVNVKKSMTYAELRELIDIEVSEQEDRFATIALSSRRVLRRSNSRVFL